MYELKVIFQNIFLLSILGSVSVTLLTRKVILLMCG